MLNKKVIRIIAIVMAVLMLLGVFGVAITAFAADENVMLTSAIPATGQKSSKVPIIVAVISLLVAIICVILTPKKKAKEDVESDYIKEEEVESGLNFFTSRKQDVFMVKPEDDVSTGDQESVDTKEE